ncbi:SusD/RagB family nutrient-binding outer membrane lipoprotein [Pedobacter sp. HMF7647]|uniref:SusD/RagB family nutrient-binding outer membrane lipoprotein n=1 Tax=Hufsiella arboris TaxID=2695275 RepID=A0A7K1YBB3_9SPHI|nr:SusD/RagB family nutrient-binding outer membrane lipoprotein [Hufsiella arboris]MXV51866.1 SusD/RagB family nutrient-binding outer membrane lipoprotein [Hufsiella arboris]
MKKKYILIPALAGLLITAGCDKNFEEINTDPTKLNSASMNYNFLFTTAELVTSGNSDANAYEDWRGNLIYASTMVQHLSSTTGYWAGDKYTLNGGYLSAYWDVNYPNSIKNITDIIENVKSNPNQTNFYNISRIFKVFMFQRMTDLYGDIPYSQSGQAYLSQNLTPVYDSQESIYADMLKELDEAAAALNAASPNTVGAADMLYGGDVSKWKKFAYSEMLRLAMRLIKVKPQDAKTWAAKAAAGGVMTAISDNAILQHPNLAPQNNLANGTGSVLISQDPNATRISKTFMDYLKSSGDPRTRFIATLVTPSNIGTNTDPAVPGYDANTNTIDYGDTTVTKQLGQPNGYDVTGTRGINTAPNWPGAQYKYSVVNRYTVARFEAPTFFLTAAETQLLLAEAAERGYVSGSAATFYTAGVTAAMQQFAQYNLGAVSGINVPASEIAYFLSKNPYAGGAAGISQINTQYWVASFGDEYEAWTNWRRSGIPALTPVAAYPGNATNGTIPRRYTYPTNEAAVNPQNYQDAVNRLSGGDKMTSRVWWDKQ